MDNCVICDKKSDTGCLIFPKSKVMICVDCQREIAKVYAQNHLDPVELISLKYKDKEPENIKLKG